jgi:hypothetical protein
MDETRNTTSYRDGNSKKIAIIIIIKQKITSVGENMEKLKPLHRLMPVMPTTWEAEIGGWWLEAD